MESATRDELWVEFKKSIDYGWFTKFKTRRGMEGYIDRMIKKRGGKYIKFVFSPEPFKYKELVLVITPEEYKRVTG